MPTLADAVKKNLGFLIAGEPGSGKTSVALLLIQQFQDKPLNSREKTYFPNPKALEVIALDIHALANPSWQEHGVTVVYDPLAILEQIHYLADEYSAREHGRKGNRLVIIFDEFEETLGKIEEHLFKQDVDNQEIKRELTFIRYLVKSLASGGRKFGINLILINQSFNCSALKIDSNHRNNFIGIFLNEAAENYVNRAGYSNQKVKDWITKDRAKKYRAMITGAMADSPILHPTHHDFLRVEDGQKSQVLVKIKTTPLTIKVVTYGLIKQSPQQSGEQSVLAPDTLADSNELQTQQDLSAIRIPDYAPKNPDLAPQAKADKTPTMSEGDLTKLELIHELWAKGEKRLKVIIPTVWSEVRGNKSSDKWVGSRAYRKCREEYRRLTGR